LIETLKQYKVDTSMVKKDEKLPTTIAFVSRDADGERDFQFNRGADQNLEQQDLSLNKIWKSSIFHFGSATALLEGALQRTYLDLMQDAKTKINSSHLIPTTEKIYGKKINNLLKKDRKKQSRRRIL